MPHRVFVYGSLKRGLQHHCELAGACFEGTTETVAGYALYVVGAYPAMVAQGAGRVVGEVYTVDRAHLARLDAFEDCPELYQRQHVRLARGGVAEAYLMPASAVEGCPQVESGRWTEEPTADLERMTSGG